MCMYKDIICKMEQCGINFTVGLEDEEISIIEQEYGIVFPEELKKFYREALPVSNGFYNWRDRNDKNVKSIKRAIQIPVQEIIEDSEDIEWSEMWGEEPANSRERREKIADMTLKAPKLIPIYSHRYMASVECEKPPIFSICGTDIIYFAKNISDYFLIEFKLKKFEGFNNDMVSYIPFWSDLI